MAMRNDKGEPDVVLELRNVSKAFVTGKQRIEALSDVSFRVRRGLVTGLIGPDAAGKTTLMRLCVGLLEPDAGQIIALGLDAARQSAQVQASVAYMPQQFGLYGDLSVQENLDLYADLHGVPRAQRPGRYERLMHMTGLAPFTSRLAGRLSGGMKQKLGLACTLVRSPRLLILDEPTVGVDPVSRRELWEIVYRLVKDEGAGVLLSTAYLDEAERCDEVVVLHEGRVLGQGTPSSFKERVQGRSFMLTAPGAQKRRLQARLVGAPGVTDTIVLGDRIRMVTDEPSPPDLAKLLPGEAGVSVEAVPARFEDSFVALLARRRSRARAGAPAADAAAEQAHTPERREGPVIEVHDLQRRFGSFYAVKGISLSVERGEVFGLLGANGAGKTTTFRMLCGLLPATAGHLSVAGVDLRVAAADARARVGYMSQKFSLYGNLSARQNLEFFSSAYGLSGRGRRDRIAWALEEFEFGPLSDANSSTLPLGYKQRLAMACALMHQPDILFLDEPTSGVDPLTRREFWGRINALAERGVTVMVTTHFMEEAEYCDRLAIMAAGDILAVGAPAEIRAAARSPEHPEPSLEDAFIRLIQSSSGAEAVA